MGTNLICLSTSDVISIVDIIISAGIGVWIATGVQKNLTKKRYLRDHFIQEINSIRQEYKDLFSEIIFEKMNAKTIKDRLKIMSARISSFDKFVHQEFKISDSLIKNEHAEFQQFITGNDEFNDQYQSDVVKFSSSTKMDVLKWQGRFADAFTKRIIDVNNAKYKHNRKKF